MEATQRLEIARDQALMSSRAKSNFLANVSHELRTPLNAIMGFSEVLSSGLFGPLTSRQAEYIGDIHDSGKRLLALINDILDISKLEAGKLDLHEETVDPVKLVKTSIHDLREVIRRAGLSVELEAKAFVPCIRADRMRLRQVIDNLLTNSIKFTPPNGSILISLIGEPDGRTVIKVADTGVGIAPADLQRVFKPFEQANSQLARKHRGAGLGLPLVKQFVEWHGGLIMIESRIMGGTCVTLELPAERTVSTTVEA
jgi:signal transduction histidine kinase